MNAPGEDAFFHNPAAQACGVDFAFPHRPVFKNLRLVVPRGKVTVIMGPSGCGKSTFLSLLGGRLSPHNGKLLVNGEEIDTGRRGRLFAMRKNMGMLFQSSALLTDISVFENVAFPLREQTNLPEDLINTLVLMKLELVGLRGTAKLMPAELSGGMARRVALARAIALDPSLIMYDEPFVGLDPISMGIIVRLIRRLNDILQMTSIVVTHDVAEGCSIADYVYLLNDGKVATQGTADEIRHSEDAHIRQFINGEPDGPVAYHYPAGDFAQSLGFNAGRQTREKDQ